METELELTLPEALKLGLRMLREDHPDAAEHVYASVLAQHPKQPDALHYLGLLKHRRGQAEAGLELMRQSLALAPGHAWMWNNLGNILVESHRLDEAQAAYGQCLALDPQAADALGNLGSLLRKCRRMEEAEDACRRAVALQPENGTAWFQLARVLIERGDIHAGLVANSKAIVLAPRDQTGRYRVARALVLLGETKQAAAIYREWLADEPDNALVKHHLAACEGDSRQPRAPDAYIETVFDSFAPSFDAKLESLGYRAPQLIAGLLAKRLTPPSRILEVVDVGCGTGLCGPMVRDWAKRLAGCDLSTGMLRLAAARDVYDKLEKAELVAYLNLHAGEFDLVISADTLCYFGDLTGVAEAAYGALRAGGRLMFTVEALTVDTAVRTNGTDGSSRMSGINGTRAAIGSSGTSSTHPPATEGHRLLQHGRYAHTRSYLCDVLCSAGFAIEDLDQELLRYEAGLPVSGWLVGALKGRPCIAEP